MHGEVRHPLLRYHAIIAPLFAHVGRCGWPLSHGAPTGVPWSQRLGVVDPVADPGEEEPTMRVWYVTLLSIVVALTCLVTPPTWAGAHSGHVMVTPADVQWADAPALPPGAQFVVLEGLAAAPERKPTVRVRWLNEAMRNTRSREEAFSGKILMRDDVFSMPCDPSSLPWRHPCRERCRTRPSQGSREAHQKIQSHWHSRLPTSY
jgi:hypothetical protein